MISYTKKVVCDRCGHSEEYEEYKLDPLAGNRLPKKWNVIHLYNTNAQIEICPKCNDDLLSYLEQLGALNMREAVYPDTKVI